MYDDQTVELLPARTTMQVARFSGLVPSIHFPDINIQVATGGIATAVNAGNISLGNQINQAIAMAGGGSNTIFSFSR